MQSDNGVHIHPPHTQPGGTAAHVGDHLHGTTPLQAAVPIARQDEVQAAWRGVVPWR